MDFADRIHPSTLFPYTLLAWNSISNGLWKITINAIQLAAVH